LEGFSIIILGRMEGELKKQKPSEKLLETLDKYVIMNSKGIRDKLGSYSKGVNEQMMCCF